VTVIDEALLERARITAPDHLDVVGGVADRLAELHGADVVICTCSTIGAIAELVGAGAGMRVVRVDRPMAERAVHVGDRITVIAAVESTVGPTRDLIGEVAESTGRSPAVEVMIVAGAWGRFEVGDHDGYLDHIARAIETAAGSCDVVVLAQASMAGAADRVDVEVPVLSSPRLAVESLL
jgi:hypothetical protein